MKRTALAALAAFVAFAAGAISAGAYTPHQLVWADNQDVSSLNPFLATSANVVPLSELTMAEFTRYDTQGKAIPELITAIPTKANGGVSADGKTVTWHLRRGVRWSDGAPFDAADVLYTYRVAVDPANDIPVRDPWERLAAVDAPNPYTVVFRFKAPYALFVQDYFSNASTSCILPKHVLGPATAIDQAPYNALPVGIGPFRYTAYHRGDDVEMEANPYYWRGKPKLQKITYKLVTDENTLFTQLETGELDLWDTINGTLAQRVKAIPAKATHLRLTAYTELLTINVRRPVVGDVRVRRALELALDRPLILAKAALGSGSVDQSVIPSMAEGYAALPIVRYDPQAAAAMLDAAGWTRGADGMRAKNGVPLAIDLALPAGQPTRATEAAIVHDAWQAVGVAVTIHPWSASQFFAPAAAGGVLMNATYDVALVANSVGPVFANVNGVYDCASATPHGFNLSRYCNPAVDALNDRYLHEFDPQARASIATAMQRAIDADTPVIPLYDRAFLSAYDARLRGYRPSSFTYWGDPLELDL